MLRRTTGGVVTSRNTGIRPDNCGEEGVELEGKAGSTGMRPWGRPKTCWVDYICRLAWEPLGTPPTGRARDIWTTLLSLCHCNLVLDKRQKKWMDGRYCFVGSASCSDG